MRRQTPRFGDWGEGCREESCCIGNILKFGRRGAKKSDGSENQWEAETPAEGSFCTKTTAAGDSERGDKGPITRRGPPNCRLRGGSGGGSLGIEGGVIRTRKESETPGEKLRGLSTQVR